MSLRKQALQAMFWVAFARYVAKVMTLLTQLILARLLVPEAFGLVAVASVVINAMRIFQDMGLGRTLIARRDDRPEALDATFFMAATTGAALCLAMLAFAPLSARFFAEPETAPLLRLLSVKLVISSLGTVPTALLQRDLKFKALAWPRLIGILAFSVVSVPLAFMGFGAWSMAWGSVAQSAVENVLIWLRSGWSPALRFQFEVAREIFAYSKHVLGISFGSFLHANLDKLLVGKLLGMSQLGYYDLAFALSGAVPALLVQIVSPVLLPAFSQIKDDRERLGRLHVRLVKFLFVFITPAVAAVALFAREGILVFYGAKWEPAIVPLQWLCLFAFVRQIAASTSAVLMVVNEVKKFNIIVYLQLFLLAVLGWPAVHFGGLSGMSLLMTFVVAFGGVLVFLVASRALGLPLRRYAAQAVSPLAACAVSVLAVVVLEHALPLEISQFTMEHFLINVLILSLKGLVLAAAYAAAEYGLDVGLRDEVRLNATKLFNDNPLRAFLRHRRTGA